MPSRVVQTRPTVVPLATNPRQPSLPRPQATGPALSGESEGQLRPVRSRRAPVRFRGSEDPQDMSGSVDVPAPRAPIGPTQATVQNAVEDAHEFFNLEDVGSDEEPTIPRARGSDYVNDLQSSEATDPLIATQSSQKQSILASSADVAFFFPKCKGEPTTCVVCKKMKDEAPTQFPANRPITYGPKTSNTSKRGHIEKYHLDVYLEEAEKNGWRIWLEGVKTAFEAGYDFRTLRQALAVPDASIRSLPPPKLDGLHNSSLPLHHVPLESGLPPFSLSALSQLLLQFIVADDQSISVVECPEFRRLLLLLRQDLRDSQIPRRTKMRELIVEAWKRYFLILKDDLAKAEGKVSFTCDIWTDENTRPFLALTAHWISKGDQTSSLKMKAGLIAFHHFPGSHTGVNIAKTILHLLDRAGVTHKIGHFTLDNAKNNDTGMRELSALLAERGIPFDPIGQRIMCFPHILNLCSGHIANEYTDVDFATVANAWVDALSPNTVIDKAAYLEALQQDPVSLGRSVVRIVRASSLRREAFDNTLITGNQMRWFTDEDGRPTKLPVLELLRDVKSRWDSIYLMINRLRTLRQALDCFFQAPAHQDIADYSLNQMHWLVLEDLETVLEIPHAAQQSMSSESLPLLSRAVPLFETIIVQWEYLRRSAPRCAPFIDVGLATARDYYHRMGRTNAYAIAMLIDPTIRLSWIEANWTEEDVAKARKAILKLMNDKRELTQLNGEASNGLSPALNPVHPAIHRPQTQATSRLASRYGLPTLYPQRPPTALQSVEQEFVSYVTASCSLEGTDPLSFWAVSRTTYPTLYQIAMDYLPIQASAVPCERVFSSGAETMTKRRNRISPVLMEALQMVKFFLKKERLNFMKGWATSMAEMAVDVNDDDVLAMVVNNVSGDGEGLYIDHIIGVICDEEADNDDDHAAELPELLC